MNNSKAWIVAFATALLLSSSYVIYSGSYSQSLPIGSNNGDRVSSPIYVWFFGYIGNTFYPKSELGITPDAMVNAAKNLSLTFGKQRLVLLTAVDEIPLPGGSINKSMIPRIASYISQLKHWAGSVYGRLDFYQFNLTSTAYGSCELGWSDCPIYNQTNMYIKQLGLDGVWFDHPSQYYETGCVGARHDICGVGPAKFNLMMQNLTNLFPRATFILNQAPNGGLPYVQQINGNCGGASGQCTWEARTYVAPSALQKTLVMDQQELQMENGLFPGHVIAHLDAEGPPAIGTNPDEPMSIFSDLNSSRESTALAALLYNSSRPASPGVEYSMVTPVLGAWTCNCSAYGTSGPNYGGTLYNALSQGKFARSTLKEFENDILKFPTPILTISSLRGQVGQQISVSGNDFLPRTAITIKFDSTAVATAFSNSTGGFSTAFSVPRTFAGPHQIKVSDGSHDLFTSFTVNPSITDSPSSASSGMTVTISGSGFGSSVALAVYFDGKPIATSPSIITTGRSGSFRALFLVPSVAPGNYKVTVVDQQGHQSSANFRVTA